MSTHFCSSFAAVARIYLVRERAAPTAAPTWCFHILGMVVSRSYVLSLRCDDVLIFTCGKATQVNFSICHNQGMDGGIRFA